MARSILHSLRRLLRDESGPTAVEYAIMLAMIIAVVIISVQLLGQNTNATFDNLAQEMDQANGGGGGGGP